MLLRGERADEPGPRDPDWKQENARPRRVLHCGKDCASIKVQEIQGYKRYQDDMRVMRVAPVLEGEGDHRGERPPEPGDRRDHEEKKAGMPWYQVSGQPPSECRLRCRSRIRAGHWWRALAPASFGNQRDSTWAHGTAFTHFHAF